MHAQAVVLFGGSCRGLRAHPHEQGAELNDLPAVPVAVVRQGAGNHRTMDFVVSFARHAGGGADVEFERHVSLKIAAFRVRLVGLLRSDPK